MSERLCVSGGDDVATVLLPAPQQLATRARRQEPMLVDGTPAFSRARGGGAAASLRRHGAVQAAAEVTPATLEPLLVAGALQRALNAAMGLRVYEKWRPPFPRFVRGADTRLCHMATRVVQQVFRSCCASGVCAVSVLNSCILKMLSIPCEMEWSEDEDDVLYALEHKRQSAATSASGHRSAVAARWINFKAWLALIKGNAVVQRSRLDPEDVNLPAAVIQHFKSDAFHEGKFVTGSAFLQAFFVFVLVRLVLCTAFAVRATPGSDTASVEVDPPFLQQLALNHWLTKPLTFHVAAAAAATAATAAAAAPPPKKKPQPPAAARTRKRRRGQAPRNTSKK